MDSAPRDTWKNLVQLQDFPELPVDLEDRIMSEIYQEQKVQQSAPIPYSVIICCFLLSLFLLCFTLYKYDHRIPYVRESGTLFLGSALLYFFHSTYDKLIGLLAKFLNHASNSKKELAH